MPVPTPLISVLIGSRPIPPPPPMPVKVQVVLEGLSNLEAPGLVTVTATTEFQLKNVELRLILPEGLLKTGGQDLWTGELKPGEPRQIRVRVKIASKGNWTVEGRLTGFHDEKKIVRSGYIGISASEQKVEVRKQPFFSRKGEAEKLPQKPSVRNQSSQSLSSPHSLLSPIPSSPGTTEICGHWSFIEEGGVTWRPARYMRVILLCERLPFPHFIDTTTDYTGYFQFSSIPSGSDGVVMLCAESKVVEVTGEGGGGYLCRVGFQNAPEGLYNIGSWATRHDWEGRAAFAIADTVILGYHFAAQRGYSHGKVHVHWPGDESYSYTEYETTGPFGIMTYNDYHHIHIAAGDEWDEDTILHEYGHSVQCVIYGDHIGPGGDHTAHKSQRFAFSEGWATFFGVAAAFCEGYDDAEFPRDTSYGAHPNLETDPHLIDHGYPADDNEDAVACILWDIFDSANDGRETLSAGMDPIWEAFFKYRRPETIHEFWDSWFSRLAHKGMATHSDYQQMWAVYFDHGINKDFTPPPNPDSFYGSHSAGVWSSSPAIRIEWPEPLDDMSGVMDYSVVWDNSPSTLPSTRMFQTGRSHGQTVSEGTWYFHIRTRDNAGNVNPDARHVGPFLIDLTPPGTPTLREDHCGSGWTTHKSPRFTWNNPGDNPGGSGFDHYEINVQPTLLLGGPPTISQSVEQYPIPHSDWADGVHTVKVRAVDKAGNPGEWSNAVTVKIDITPPTTPMLHSPADRTTTSDVTPTFYWYLASDAGSGVASYTFEICTANDFKSGVLRRITGIPPFRNDYTPDTALAPGTWYWRVRAVDNVGWLSDYSPYRTLTIQPFDFSLRVTDARFTIPAGGTVVQTIIVQLTWGTSETSQIVTLSVQGLPTGAIATFSRVTGTPTFTSRLTISTSRSTPVGAYQIYVFGSGGGQTHSTAFMLGITAISAAPPQDVS